MFDERWIENSWEYLQKIKKVYKNISLIIYRRAVFCLHIKETNSESVGSEKKGEMLSYLVHSYTPKHEIQRKFPKYSIIKVHRIPVKMYLVKVKIEVNKVNIKDTRTKSLTSIWYPYSHFEQFIHTFSSVYTVDFEQLSVSWDGVCYYPIPLSFRRSTAFVGAALIRQQCL